MSIYAQVQDGAIFKYPLTLYDIKTFHTNTSFVEGLLLLPEGFVEVQIHDTPQVLWNQRWTEVDPVFDVEDGKWHQSFVVTDLTPEEETEYINSLKRIKSEEINTSRLEANFKSFTYMGKEIAAAALDRSDIDGTNGEIQNTGQLPAHWPGGWKTVDNSYVPIATVDDWKAFYSAMYLQGLTNFMKAQTLKAQLSAASTPEQIAAIAWNTEEVPND